MKFSLDILQKNAMLIHKPYTKINTQLLPRRQNGNVQVCFEPTMQSIHHIFLLPLLFMRALYSYITAAISHPPLANCQSKIINPQSLPPPECWHNRIHWCSGKPSPAAGRQKTPAAGILLLPRLLRVGWLVWVKGVDNVRFFISSFDPILNSIDEIRFQNAPLKLW